MFNWFMELFATPEVAPVVEVPEVVEETVENEDLRKKFLVEVTVSKDTKIRPLKAAMEVALNGVNPDCSDWVVKSYYNR